jgi:hypothetical protein
MDIFFSDGMWNSGPKFVQTFQLQPVYMKEELNFFLSFKQARKLILGTEVHLCPNAVSFNSAKTFWHILPLTRDKQYQKVGVNEWC